MTIDLQRVEHLFPPYKLTELFPADRTDRFFEALLGDAREGAYDIRLAFAGVQPDLLRFHFELRQRPGKCLACNLTYGLPHVFARHPVIDVKGLIAAIDSMLDGRARCKSWRLGETREITPQLHHIELAIELEN